MYTYVYLMYCFLLSISMFWHRQALFESKGDKLSSSAECRIRTHQGLRHQIASRLNARRQTDWAIEDQAKNLNSTARPYDQRAFSPLDPTAVLAFAPGSGQTLIWLVLSFLLNIYTYLNLMYISMIYNINYFYTRKTLILRRFRVLACPDGSGRCAWYSPWYTCIYSGG